MRIKGLFIFLFLLSLRPSFREYKSEYKQKFRPFSQYEYCGDGKFYNTSISPPSESAVDGGHRSRQETSLHLSGEPWYQEVIELRKAAADYKCRGWGTDLVPPHLSNIYSQHVDEASNRESLSPLALAITPRYSSTMEGIFFATFRCLHRVLKSNINKKFSVGSKDTRQGIFILILVI